MNKLRKKIVIVILWSILTSGYIGTGIGLIVGGWLQYCFDTSRLSDDIGKVVYWAKKYEGTPPLNYFKPEELGISKVIHHGYDDPDGVDIVILNEPFPLKERRPIFKWNERFYKISDESGPFYKSSPCPRVQIVVNFMMTTGLIIVVVWLGIVYYHLKKYGYVEFNMVMVRLDLVGALLRRKLVDAEILQDLFGPNVTMIWEQVKPLLEEKKRQTGKPHVYPAVEYLYNEMQKREQQLATT